MIKLDISTLIFFYVLLSVIIILVIWIIYGYKSIKHFSANDVDYIWKCSVCFNVYVDSKREDISLCPVCGSYNKRQSSDSKEVTG